MSLLGIGIGIGVEYRLSATPQIIADYYFATSGNDTTGDGTLAKPYKTIAKANALSISSGKVVAFNGGDTFSGTLVAKSGVTYGAYGSGKAIISAGSGDGITGSNLAATIQDLDITGDGTAGKFGVIFTNDQAGNTKISGVTIQRCLVHGFGEGGIKLYGNNGISGFSNFNINNNIVHDCTQNSLHAGTAGIEVLSDPGYNVNPDLNPSHINGTISGCTVYNCLGYGPASTADGNWVGSGIFVAECKTVQVTNCTAYNNGANCANFAGPCGIWMADCADTTIRFCESHHNAAQQIDGNGFDMDAGTIRGLIEYCYSHDNYGAGFVIITYADGALASNDCTIRFNISENDGTGWAAAGIFIDQGDGTLTNVKVYNNTIYVNSATSVPLYFNASAISGFADNNILFQAGSAKLVRVVTTPITLSNNDYFRSAGFSAEWNGSTYTSLAAWKTASSKDAAGLAVNPRLTNPGAGVDTGYHLQSGSPMIGAGNNVVTAHGVTLSSHGDYYGSTVIASAMPIGAAVT